MNLSVKVELPTSPSIATTSGRAPSATSASPKAALVATFMPISYLGRVTSCRSRAGAAAGRDGRGGVATLMSVTPPSTADGGVPSLGLQRFSVPAAGILNLRYTFTLDGLRQDDGGQLRPLGQRQGVVDLLQVVPVDHHGAAAERLHAPPVGVQVPLQFRGSRLPQPVHVHDRREVVEPVERRLVERLPHRALGHLAVPAQHPHAVVLCVEPLAGQRDAHAVGQALPQRPGGHVHPRQHRGGVSLQRRADPAVGLHQLAVVDHAHRLVERVEQRRGVPLGEDEVVVVGPAGPAPVVVQVPAEQDRHEVGGGEA